MSSTAAGTSARPTRLHGCTRRSRRACRPSASCGRPRSTRSGSFASSYTPASSPCQRQRGWKCRPTSRSASASTCLPLSSSSMPARSAGSASRRHSSRSSSAPGSDVAPRRGRNSATRSAAPPRSTEPARRKATPTSTSRPRDQERRVTPCPTCGSNSRAAAPNPTSGTPMTVRLALSRAEAAQSLGVSIDYLDEHVLPELRIVRRGRRKLDPRLRAGALAASQRRARPGRSTAAVTLTATGPETPANGRVRASCAPASYHAAPKVNGRAPRQRPRPGTRR